MAGQQGPGASTHPTARHSEGEDLAPGLCRTPCAAVGARVTLALKGFEDENTVIREKNYAPRFAWLCKCSGREEGARGQPDGGTPWSASAVAARRARGRARAAGWVSSPRGMTPNRKQPQRAEPGCRSGAPAVSWAGGAALAPPFMGCSANKPSLLSASLPLPHSLKVLAEAPVNATASIWYPDCALSSCSDTG